MVMDGLSDVSFLVHGTVIPALKPFLKYNNKYFADLFKQYEQSSEPIPLDNCITPEGFNSMLLYYGFGKPNPEIPYLADALIASLFLHEEELYNNFKKYIFIYLLNSIALNKMNDELLIRIFTLVPSIKDINMKQSILQISLDYFINNSNRLIESHPPVITSLEVLNFVLDLPNLKVPNEKLLADMLFHIYKQSIRLEPERKAELYKDFEAAAFKINWNDVANVSPKDVALFHNFNTIVNSENSNKRIYLNPIIIPPSPAFTYNSNITINNRMQMKNINQQPLQLPNPTFTPTKNRLPKSLQALDTEISPITSQPTTPIIFQLQQPQVLQPQLPQQQQQHKRKSRKSQSQPQPQEPKAQSYNRQNRSKSMINTQYSEMEEETEDDGNRYNNNNNQRIYSRQNINQINEQYQYPMSMPLQQLQSNTYNNIRQGDIQPIIQLTSNNNNNNTSTRQLQQQQQQQHDDDLLLYTNSPSNNPEQPSKVRISHISPHLISKQQQQQQPRTILQTAISNNYISESESDTGGGGNGSGYNNFDRITSIPKRTSYLQNNNNNSQPKLLKKYESESSAMEYSGSENTADENDDLNNNRNINNDLSKGRRGRKSNNNNINNNETVKSTSTKRKSRKRSTEIVNGITTIESITPPINTKRRGRKKNRNRKNSSESNDDEYISNIEEEEEYGDEEDDDYGNDSNSSRKKRKIHNTNQQQQQSPPPSQQQQQQSQSLSPLQQITLNSQPIAERTRSRSRSKSKRGEDRSDLEEENQQTSYNKSITLSSKSVIKSLDTDVMSNMNRNNNSNYNDNSFEDYIHPSNMNNNNYMNISNDSIDDERKVNICEYIKRNQIQSNRYNNSDSITQDYQSSAIVSVNSATTTPENLSNQIIEVNNNKTISSVDDQLLDNIIKKYTPKRTFNIDSRDKSQISELFKKKLPPLSTNMPLKYLITLLLFYKETNTYLNRYNNNYHDSNEVVIHLIISEHQANIKSFYKDSYPSCLLPFFPQYCYDIYENGGIDIIAQLLNLYKSQNSSETEIYNLTDDECMLINRCINNADDFAKFSSKCVDEEDVERICIYNNFYFYFLDPLLSYFQDKMYSRLYQVCINRYASISSQLSKFSNLTYKIFPKKTINITKNGVITCYSEQEKTESEYIVTCSNCISSVTSKLNIEYKSILFHFLLLYRIRISRFL